MSWYFSGFPCALTVAKVSRLVMKILAFICGFQGRKSYRTQRSRGGGFEWCTPTCLCWKIARTLPFLSSVGCRVFIRRYIPLSWVNFPRTKAGNGYRVQYPYLGYCGKGVCDEVFMVSHFLSLLQEVCFWINAPNKYIVQPPCSQIPLRVRNVGIIMSSDYVETGKNVVHNLQNLFVFTG